MTHTDYTKEILNIKDNNVYFYENCLETRKEGNIEIKVFHGYLTYNPEYCTHCGCINNGPNDIIKWAYDKNCLIKIPKVSNFNTILLLDKQRFYCKHCKRTFSATTSLIDYHKQISNNTKLSIILDLMKKGSEKDIAERNNVSTNSVNRILDSICNDKLIKNNATLPESFGIDELTATKDTKGKYAFIIVDHNKHNIFDLLDSRRNIDIETYFRRYPRFEREKVKAITLDLYGPYYKLMHSLFPNAILIPDRFHFILQPRNALDKTRIKLISKSNSDYRKFKKYWKLLLKNEEELDDTKKIYSNNFKTEVTQKYIVTYLIHKNPIIYATYNYYQGILNAIKNRDKDKFINIIHHFSKSNMSQYAIKTNKTFLKMEKYLINSFEYQLSNGVVEGTNNLIKQVKHNACGYRKFKHFKCRIMLIKGLFNPIQA